MQARDPHRFVNELDASATERLVARLENRAKDKVFTRLFDKYVAELRLPASARVLEIGCGAGAMLRALARRADFTGHAVGIDQSPVFVDAARQLADSEGVGQRLQFEVGDAHAIQFADAEFDAVIVNTVMSHVSNPDAVIAEVARVLRSGGKVAVFDGDYASLTYAHPDAEIGTRMDRALANATFNNPRIMRELARLLPEHGLKLLAAWGDAVTEIGSGSFFRTFAETYVSYVIDAGFLPADEVRAWHAVQKQAMENGTFFAGCTYYTFIAERPSAS